MRQSLFALALLPLIAAPASAHFLEVLPSADVLPEGGHVDLSLIFTHPFEGAPVMDMAPPAQVGVLKDGEIADLTGTIAPVPVGEAMSWSLGYDLAEPGAAIFFVTPEPYWEPAEGKYIVHHSKVIVDSYASGEGWDALVGLPVEIRPLTRPSGLWAGNIFSGVALAQGAPVPYAEIEVEWVNDGSVTAPNEAFVTQVITADANGTFSYAMPKAGWWGFAALVEGDQPMTSPEGEEVPVEQGGLIWVNVTDMGAK